MLRDAISICLTYLLATVHLKKNVIVTSNHEFDYFGNVLKYDYSESTSTEYVYSISA